MQNNLGFIDYLFERLMVGDASVITSDNILSLNNEALSIYQLDTLKKDEIEKLKKIIMICNVLYNRTDMTILPVEDGFYDLLLEKYKTYDANFQVGANIVEFRNFIQNDVSNPVKVASCPIIFDEPVERDELHQYVYDHIMVDSNLNSRDFAISPIEFENEYISKRTHNTEHNHPSLVGTLDKCKFVFNIDAINAGVFEDNNVKILERDFFQDHISKGIISPNQEIEVVVELKYDGVSVEADCGLEVISARSRGDTGIGVAIDMSPILKGYIFKQAGCMIGEKPVGVKFEAIMTKSNLDRFNELRGYNYSNCRSAIVGLFGASDAYMFRDLITLIPLAVDRDDMPQINNRMLEIEFLNSVFVSHGEPLRYCYFKGTVVEILYMIKCFVDEAKIARNYLDFMFDGIVVSYLDEKIREKLGRKNNINKYSVAVKFDAEEKQTIFRGYTYEIGQHGNVTPMIHYDPVEFIGTIHTKSTGSSLNRFNELGLKYGDYINVAYVNDVMPYVSKLDCDHNRNNPNPIIEIIKSCPVCGADLIVSDSGKSLLCPNIECPARSLSRMVNMFTKLNIKGFAEAAFKALNKNHLYELVDLDIDWLRGTLGEADSISFKNVMNQLKTQPLKDYIIMGSLGFGSIAHKKWQSILQNITLKDLYELYLSSRCEDEFRQKLIMRVPGIGEVTSYTIVKEFPFFEKDIVEILSWGNLVDSFGANNEGKLQIRFTGIRNKQLSELLCNAGYDADDSSSVTKKTNILIVPYDGFSSSKTNKAPEGCKIVSMDEFTKNMELYIGEKLI